MRNNRMTALTTCIAAVAGLLASCGADSTTSEKIEPAVIVSIPGSTVQQVTLTQDAAERISLETSEITAGAGSEMVMPYGAVIYDADGLAWAFVVKGDNVFVREQVEIDRIEGDSAFLTGGPKIGTSVAVVGVAELFGAETGIGK